jgi:outer membrane protein assembly factor BamB
MSFEQAVSGLRLLIPVLTGFFLLGCAGPEKPKPADLGVNVPLMGVKTVWTNGVGPIMFPIDTKVVGNSVYLASSDGVILALDARTGADIWRTKLEAGVSAGVGSDGRYVAVVSQENDVIAIEAGTEIWRQKLSATTQTSPLVAGSRVFTLSADRSVNAFDAATGRKLWQQQRAVDPLVLSQAGVLIAVNDTLVVGLGGRLVGMNPQNGIIRWEVPIATNRGTNEIERLVDLVAGVSRVGDEICLKAFQSSIACVNASKGILRWSKPTSGGQGITGDGSTVYTVESDGKLTGWKRSDGERAWSSDRLRFRTLTAPSQVGQSLVVGDDAGLLHFLSVVDGTPLNRVMTDSSSIASAPALVGQTLVAVTRRGGVFGFRPE